MRRFALVLLVFGILLIRNLLQSETMEKNYGNTMTVLLVLHQVSWGWILVHVRQGWKKPGFKKKTSPVGFFGFFLVFCFFLFFFGFLGCFAQKRGF
jgi:hypothetical protein